MPVPTLFKKGYLIGKNLENEVPLDYIMQWFRDSNNKILILQSSTGSGKSTVLPPEFFQQINPYKNVICTQPRIINATSIPHQIVPFYATRDIPLVLGYNLGFSTGLYSIHTTIPGIMYMTIGVFYAILMVYTDDEIIEKYSCIFIDEAHERQSMLDVVLYMVKQFLLRNARNKNCPFIVIMSATLDIPKFTEYFNTKDVIEVKGETYAINEIFIEYDSKNIFKDIVTQIVKYHENNLNQKIFVDILVFLSGVVDIQKTAMFLKRATQQNKIFKQYPILIVEVTKDTNEKNPKEIYAKLDKLRVTIDNKTVQPFRRVFIATNVVETGVTLENLVCVIDPGYYKSAEYNPIHECYSLIAKPITKSMHIQRRGRVGRIAPGDCITMFTKKTFDLLYDNSFSDIIKTDNTVDILNIIVKLSELVKAKTTFEILASFYPKPVNVFNIDLFEQPSMHSMNNSLNNLFYLGAIDKNKLLTPIGLIMGRFKRINLNLIKMILTGYCYDIAIIDLINIASVFEAGILNLREKKIDLIFLNDDFINAILFADFLMETSIFEIYQNIKIFDNRENTIATMMALGLNPFKNYNNRLNTITDANKKIQYVKMIKTCIYEGFKMNIARRMHDGSYVNRLNKTIKVNGINVDKINPEFIVYNKLLFKHNMKSEKFIYKSEFTCILDGFVNVDLYFDVNV